MKIFFVVILTTYYLILNTELVHATSMSNDNYILQMQQAENVLEVTPQPSSTPVEEKPYIISSPTGTFEFSVSQTLIDFGTLSPTNPITRTTGLTVSHSSNVGYSIFAYENHPLTNQEDTPIPDTTCDDGICKENIASLWTNILTYGFGYRCDNILGQDCPRDFSDTNFFRQFADVSQREMPQVILNTQSSDTNSQIDITYKINVSNTFKSTSYSNTITYIAVPTF